MQETLTGFNPKTLPKWAAILPIALVALGLVACAGDAAPSAIPQVEEPTGSKVIDQTGAELYAANCQSCHGDRDGKGAILGAPSHGETGHTWHHPDAQLKDWIMNGKPFSRMPAFQDMLNESEVDAILAYIKTWWTEAQRQGQADVSQRYQEALDRQAQGQ